MTKEKVSNAAEVVARWYGGVNIGKARFEHICERARWVLREAGHVAGQGVQHNWGSKGHSLGGQSTCELVAKPERERAAGPLPNTQPQSKRKREGGDSGDDGNVVARRAACAAAALRRAVSSVSSQEPTTAAASTLATDRGDGVVVNAPRKELARGGGDGGREKAHIIGQGVWRGKTRGACRFRLAWNLTALRPEHGSVGCAHSSTEAASAMHAKYVTLAALEI